MTKHFTLVCEECYRQRTFRSEEEDRDAAVEEIIQAIDASGWAQFDGNVGLCPACVEKVDESMLGVPE